jgi:uncharacterized protein (DUF2336 family)
MSAQPTLIDELESLIANREIGRRAEVLRRVTDLFGSTSAQFSDDQIALFDDVMLRLAREIDSSARAAFGERLAAIPQAPPQVTRALALDDEISVAGPVLANADGLDEATLLESARTKSQQHLLAISRRASLVESVTDVLVERGDQQVALSTAANPGAKFSEFGYSTLVQRSESDGDLALCVWSRSGLPRHHLLKLFATASEAVRSKLAAADRGKADLIRDMVAKASEQLQSEARAGSADYAAAQVSVRALHQRGELSEGSLSSFARTGRFDEATVALSIMCDLPVGLIERALVQEQPDTILVLAKAIGISWETTRAIIQLKPGARERSGNELEQWRERFAKLKPETARKAIQFYRLRERTAGAKPN